MQTQRSTTEISHRPALNFESPEPIDPPDGQGGSGGGTPTTPPPEEEEEETPNP